MFQQMMWASFINMLLLLLSATDGAIEPISIPATSGTCPLQADRDAARQQIDTNVVNSLRDYVNRTIMGSPQEPLGSPDPQEPLGSIVPECGEGQWFQVANLNMSDPAQQCPSAWMEFNNGGVRGCERIQNVDGGCEGPLYSTGRNYSRVCGRATGYQIGGVAAFGFNSITTINEAFFYGLILTHGMPRMHIWTFAAGLTEGGHYESDSWECPCTLPGSSSLPVPQFVGNNYFCESGNAGTDWIPNNLYSGDPLWDGEQCGSEGQCCVNENSPPWFSTTLPIPTADSIEARICIPASSPEEEVILQKLVIYIQ